MAAFRGGLDSVLMSGSRENRCQRDAKGYVMRYDRARSSLRVSRRDDNSRR